MEGSPLATLFRFWGYRRVYPVPSSLCLSQRSSQTKSLGLMEFHRRADARRLATCDDHRNDGVYASVADILYIRRTRVCAAERFFSTHGVGLAGYRLKAGMTGNSG